MLCPAPPCIHAAPSRAEGTLYHQRVCCALRPGTFLCLHNPWPVFMMPSSRNCHATTGLEGSVCVWGLLPMPTTKGAPSSHASLTPLLRIHEHVPPMPSCAQVPFRVPSIPATAATYRQHYRRYRQHYRRYRQHYRCYRCRRRSDRCCRPPGRHCRLRHYRRSCAAGSTAALPLPTSPTVVASAIVAVPPSPLPYAGMS